MNINGNKGILVPAMIIMHTRAEYTPRRSLPGVAYGHLAQKTYSARWTWIDSQAALFVETNWQL